MERRDDISIVFADGERMFFPALTGSSVLASAEKAGNALAHNCREGTCRTCAARDDNGKEVLLCIEPARAGLNVSVPYRRADVTAPSLRRAKINRFSRVSRSVWEIRYRLQFPLPFLPGQYVEATFPGFDGPRRFSMANEPSAKEQVFHVRDMQGGAMSAYLSGPAKPNDLFTLRGPLGVFYLRATPKPKLFVSGGTGLAPIMSMLRSIDPATAPRLAVVAGFTDGEDAYAIDELRALAADLPLEVVLTAEKTNASWRGQVGNTVEGLRMVRSVSLEAGIEAYLCGPPGMIAAVREALSTSSIAQSDIFNEEFIPAPTK